MEIKAEELRDIVRSEIERNAIQRAVEMTEKERPQVRWQDALRHPATLTILAFFLTAVVGVYVEGLLNQSAKERAEFAARVAEATAVEERELKTVDDLTELISARWAATALLRSSLKRGNRDEIERRLEAYELAYNRWNTERPVLDLQIRQIMTPQNSMIPLNETLFEKAVIQGIDANFGNLHACFTHIEDRSRTSDAEWIPKFWIKQCGLATPNASSVWSGPTWGKLRRTNNCAREIAVQFSRVIREKKMRALDQMPADYDRSDFKKAYEQRIRDYCHIKDDDA